MTLLDQRDPPVRREDAAPLRPGDWTRDLALGVRFAVSGGREGWTRTALTAVGVGLGVVLLFLAASVPHMNDARAQRGQARETANVTSETSVKHRTDSTFLWDDATTEYHGDAVGGQLLRPEGPKAPAPPGAGRIPGPGEMLVSPALRDLLGSSDGALLKQRLDYRIVGTIAGRGLLDPGELRFYAGSATLSTDNGGVRSARYGDHVVPKRFDAALVVLIILICVALLVPVAIFIGTAVRFGGDRKDRRLAALRLVGADIRMTRRIASGEALSGAVLGLLIGAGLFLLARQFAGAVRLWGFSAFPSDVFPVPALGALVVVAVPAAAVLVTQSALRSVAIEPLGVVRNNGLRRRRLWWRLLMPVAGIAVLAMTGTVDDTTTVGPYPIAAGAVLILIGLAALLPWLVEAAVARLRGGPVPWQLAARRLQLNSGTAARAVSGITVAVAGAIALQMMFGGMEQEFLTLTGQNPARADMSVSAASGDGKQAEQWIEDFRNTEGVTAVLGTVETYVIRPGRVTGGQVQPTTTLTVAGCTTLRELALLPSCRDGDTFVSHVPGQKRQNDWVDRTARPGKPVDLNTLSVENGSPSQLWTLPASARTVQARHDPVGTTHDGIFATPGAVAPGLLKEATTDIALRIDHGVPDAREYVRNTAARISPTMSVWAVEKLQRDKQYATVQTGLLIGGTATMVLIAASMLVSQIEQLRERRRLLSVLVAFGTRRSTLAWSVLWGTAVPVLLGTTLAILGGLALGSLMLDIVAKPVRDWWVFVPFAGAGAAVILLVTALSLPPLWRMMRPEGLRTE
jgi:hypothetical protein